jgi:ribosome maturation factor RimP
MAQGILDPALIADLASIAEAEGCVLLRAERHGKILRLILDRPDEDVNLDHCSRVSRQASALLDVMEPAGLGSYVLEVGSPGLDRELYGQDDYRRFLGRLARITFRDPQGARQTIVGRLEAFREEGEGEITLLEVLTKKQTREHVIPLPAIELARLEIEL